MRPWKLVNKTARNKESLKEDEDECNWEMLASSDLVIGHFLDVMDGNIFWQPGRVFLTSQ